VFSFLIDLLMGILTFAGAAFAYIISKSIWLTLAVIVAEAMIVRSLKPMVQAAWEHKHAPRKLSVLLESGTESQGTHGVKFLLMTQNVNFAPSIPEQRGLLNGLLQEGIDKLRTSSRIFDYRYSLVLEKGYPLQVSYSSCGRGTWQVRLCYFRWMKDFGLSSFNDGLENRDIFTLDMLITDPRSGCVNGAMLQAVFDRRLPVPTNS
jgi:hypothetical protein